MRRMLISSKFNVMDSSRNGAYGATQYKRHNKEWIDYRMNIFQNLTLKSLKNQTNQDFVAVYAYDDISEPLIFDALSKYEPLPPNVIFVKKSEYSTLIEQLCEGYSSLFYTRLDSDDMYCKDYIERLHNIQLKDDTQALLSIRGYMYDIVGNRIQKYFHDRLTYYTLIYRINDPDNPFNSLDVTPYDLLVNFSHGRIVDYNPEIIEGRNFMFNIHGNNSDSVFAEYDWGFAKSEGLITDENEKQDIFSQFF